MKQNLALLKEKEKNHRAPLEEYFLPLNNIGQTKVRNPVSLIESVLASRLKTGDNSAFSFIFTALYKDLVMFASSFTHDLGNAEEIVQEVFVRLWEEHESIEISISLRSYLLKLVQNKCIDLYRHNKIKQTHNNFILKSSSQFEFDTDNYIFYSELKEQLFNALEIMPKPISEAFQMNRFKGLKYHEIADIMGVSVRTIEVRIGRALYFLRNFLKDYFAIIIIYLSLVFFTSK